MVNVCSVNSCTFDATYDRKCALHCEKGKYQDDRRNGVLRDFYECLGKYIYNELSTQVKSDILKLCKEVSCFPLPKGEYTVLFELVKMGGGGDLTQILSEKIIYFGDIKFPERKSKDSFDFFTYFGIFKGIHFDRSELSFSNFDLPKVKVFFQDCKFINDWSIHSYSILEDVESKTLFQNCIFEGVVSTASEENSRDVLKIEHHLFNDCEFKKTLLIMRGEIKTNIFNNSERYEQILNELIISGGEFEGRFILNHAKLKTLKIRDVEFKRKFELKESYIENADIYNVNFYKLFDAYQTEFSNFKISRSIFNDFTGFEKCKFGVEYASSCQATEFEYVTFLNFANFRNAKFYNGLDFEHTNLKEPLNFLNAYIAPKNTNRETYRIIKHSFDKIGNQIEANKYFSFEMKKYKEELKEQIEKFKRVKRFRLLKNKLEKKKANSVIPKSIEKLIYIKSKLKSEQWNYRVYKLNEWISNFGENFLKPLKLMLIGAIFYYMLVLGYEYNLLYKFDESTNNIINKFMTQVNLFAKGIPPYGKLLKEGMEFTTLLFHVFFLTCTWQFIVALKRRTKR
jgi:uncharacterized protein YjbI with pentapeptide repeats